MKPQPKLFTFEQVDTTLIVIPRSHLSDILLEGVEESRELLEKAMQTDIETVVFDLQKVEYFATDFLSLMLKTWKRIRGRDARMVLAGVSGKGREVLAICQLDNLWPIFENRQAALDAISP